MLVKYLDFRVYTEGTSVDIWNRVIHSTVLDAVVHNLQQLLNYLRLQYTVHCIVQLSVHTAISQSKEYTL